MHAFDTGESAQPFTERQGDRETERQRDGDRDRDRDRVREEKKGVKKKQKKGGGKKRKWEGKRKEEEKRKEEQEEQEEEGSSHDVRLRWCTRVHTTTLAFSNSLFSHIRFRNVWFSPPHPFGFPPFCLSPFLRFLSPSLLPPIWLIPLSVCFLN